MINPTDAAVFLFVQAVAALLRDIKQQLPQESLETDSMYRYSVARLREHIEQAPDAPPEVRQLAEGLVDAVHEVLQTLDYIDDETT